VDSIAVGSYFARKKEDKENSSVDRSLVHATKPSVAATMRQSDASLAEVTLLAAKKEDKKRKLEITPAAKEEIKKRRVERDFPSRLSLPGETQEVRSESPKLKKLSKPSTSREDSSGRKKEIISKTNARASKAQGKTALTKKKFNEFLKGVHFAISGFQNPLRGEIRQKALDMGARYYGDWNSSCTHLVCAFTNTPKFNQVKGKGKIVKKEWIELCHSHRKRFPWRRFCLDKDDQNKDESEEEIFEQVEENIDFDPDVEIEQIKDAENKKKKFEEVNKADFDCDTDEEIERIKAEEKINQNDARANDDEERQALALGEEASSVKKKNNPNNISREEIDKYDCETDDEEGNKSDPYDAETDIDEEEIERLVPNVSNVAYEELPSFFRGTNFYVDALFGSNEKKLLARYITACGGCVSGTPPFTNIQIVISKSKKKTEELRMWDEKTLFVKPAWLFACKDADAFLDPSKFIVI